jgi:hypothetical protein
MTDYLFDKAMREHVLPQLSKEEPSVVLMDGASCHFNPRLLLHGRADTRAAGPPVFFFERTRRICPALLPHRTTTQSLVHFNARGVNYCSRRAVRAIATRS